MHTGTEGRRVGGSTGGSAGGGCVATGLGCWGADRACRPSSTSQAAAVVDNDKIDEINILQATMLAMRRAVEGLCVAPEHLLVDARRVSLEIPQQAIIKGDAKSHSIAAASILAKTTRDARMKAYDATYPGYGFARVSDKMRDHWDELLSGYFHGRRSLKGLFLIVDIRRRLQDYDRQMMAFAGELPIHILLTKADKLKRGQASTALLEVQKEVGDRASVQLFSALKRTGENQAREMLDRFLGH